MRICKQVALSLLLLTGPANAQIVRQDPAASPWLNKIAPQVTRMGDITLMARNCGLWDFETYSHFSADTLRAGERLPKEDSFFAAQLFNDGGDLADAHFKASAKTACAELTPAVNVLLEDLRTGRHGLWDWP